MKNVILVILGLLILGGGAYYWYTTREKPDVSDMMIENTGSESSNTTEETLLAQEESEQSTGVETATLESLMNSGRNVSCRFEQTEGTTKIMGTYNVAGTKMSGDYTMTQADGTTSTIKMLSDGQFMYTWGDALQGMGMKVDLTKAKEISAQAQTNATASGSQPQFDSFDEPMQFTCAPWTADPAVFVVPTDVRFVTL